MSPKLERGRQMTDGEKCGNTDSTLYASHRDDRSTNLPSAGP